MILFLVASCAILPADALQTRTDADGDGICATRWLIEGCDDCDDADASVFPGADDPWYDGVDQNCDQANDFDADGDGVSGGEAGEDCDDLDPLRFPGAVERCNGQDDACLGAVPNDEIDEDGDGVLACGDCDDAEPTAFPGAVESCDPARIDEDCNALADDDDPSVGRATTMYADADADGYGDPATTAQRCHPDATWVRNGEDCDDLDADIHPETTWYLDTDGDGYGDPSAASVGCEAPDGAVQIGGDCDDDASNIWPGAAEACDQLDNDCDSLIDLKDPDVDPTDSTWYRDADGDTWGNTAVSWASCEAIAGWVQRSGDCDDDVAAAWPGGTEVCDDADNDCDGGIDDEDAEGVSGAPEWYVDADGDGAGDASLPITACRPGAGYAETPDDCDESDPSVYPGAPEVCGSADDDCDGLFDEDDPDLVDARPWYLDTDGDEFGVGPVVFRCDPQTGEVAFGGDCDDNDPTTFPGATERCATAGDDNCDGATNEENSEGCFERFADNDGDLWGAGDARCICEDETPWTAAGDGDCDDTDVGVYPGRAEDCATPADDDCDGPTTAIDAENCSTWFADADNDGSGDATLSVCSCAATALYSTLQSGDCDDGNSVIWPNAPPICNDAVDNDCDGEADVCDVANTDFSVLGVAAADAAGTGIAISDIDGDGYGDIVIGIPGDDAAGDGAGALEVWSGRDHEWATSPMLRLSGTEAGMTLGATLDGGFDVTGDGLDDLVVGAPDNGATYPAGNAYVVTASALGSTNIEAAWQHFEGESEYTYHLFDWEYDEAGRSVSVIPDVTGDGIADLVIGTLQRTEYYILFFTSISEKDILRIHSGATAGTRDVDSDLATWSADGLGTGGPYATATAADLDGDGSNELVVGNMLASSPASSSGSVSTFSTVTGELDESGATHVVGGGGSGWQVGDQLSSGEDIDGDGQIDLVVTSSLRNTDDTDAGVIWILTDFYGIDQVDESWATITGDSTGDRTGGSVRLLEDVDGDGRADLLVGSDGDDVLSAAGGSVCLFTGLGLGTFDLGDATVCWAGTSPGDDAGASLAAGDVNGDGWLDLAFGTPYDDTQASNAGSASVVLNTGAW